MTTNVQVNWDNTATLVLPDDVTVSTIEVILRNVQTLEGVAHGFIPGAVSLYDFGALDDGGYELYFVLYNDLGNEVYGVAAPNGLLLPAPSGTNTITNVPENFTFTLS
jgi:hypothetical protein